MPADRIILTLRGDRAAARPSGFLGKHLFARYLEAVRGAGAQFDRSGKAYLCPIDRVPALIENLEHAAFEPVIAPDLQERLKARAEAIRNDIASADQRLAKIERELAERQLALFAHQRDGISWLAPRRAGFLFDEMGLGKSAQALLAAPEGAPINVVCPAVVKYNWAAEVRLWLPEYRVRVLQGRNKWEWAVPGEVCIANYEVLPKLEGTGARARIPDERYGLPSKGTVLVADEIHYAKNPKAQRTRALRAVARAILDRDGRAWGLTGTPLTNRPPELWNVLRTIGLAESAFDSWPRFRDLLGGIEGKWGLEWTDEVDPSVPARLRRVSLYRRRTDVLDLPPKMRTRVDVEGEFPPNVRKLLDAVVETLAGQGVDLDEAAEMVDLTKVTGAAFEELAKARSALAIAKIPAMIDLVKEYEEADEPLVVFSAHRAPIQTLGARKHWGCITGNTPAKERQRAVELFQRGELKGLACTIKAGGVGITLTRAAHEIFVDCAWTPADNNQAEDRCCRIGQERPVLIKRLVADHKLDRRVEEILRRKQELIDSAVSPSAVARPTKDHSATLRADAQTLDRVASGTAPPKPARPQRHAPETPVERWALEGLLTLADLDPDGARVENGVGFNKLDQSVGHSLAQQAAQHRALTPKQYTLACKVLRKYHRQIGPMPEEGSRD